MCFRYIGASAGARSLTQSATVLAVRTIRFDMAGRVFQGVPAPSNLVVPPHYYADDNTIVVGVDPGAA